VNSRNSKQKTVTVPNKSASIPTYALRELIRHEWLPRTIGEDLRRELWRIFMREFPPFYEEWRQPEDIERRMQIMGRIEEIVRTQSRKFLREDEVGDESIWERIVFSGSVALAMIVPNWEIIPFQEVFLDFGIPIGAMCAIEYRHWARTRNLEHSFAMFLAKERMSKEDAMETKWFREIPPFRHFLDDKPGIMALYRTFAITQARILDLDQDVDFLIALIKRACENQRSEKGILPYIAGVADKVIVQKTLSHEQGLKECSKGFSIAESLGQFQEVLSKIVSRWEIV
jgi:hypothetical protein